MMEFGHGKHIRLGKIIFIRILPPTSNAQGGTVIKVLVPFSSSSNCSGASVAGHSSISPGLFSCEEEGGVKMFSTYKELPLSCGTPSPRGGARHCVRCHQEKVGQYLINRKLTETVPFSINVVWLWRRFGLPRSS